MEIRVDSPIFLSFKGGSSEYISVQSVVLDSKISSKLLSVSGSLATTDDDWSIGCWFDDDIDADVTFGGMGWVEKGMDWPRPFSKGGTTASISVRFISFLN